MPLFATVVPAAVSVAVRVRSSVGPAKPNMPASANDSAYGKVNRCGTLGGIVGSSGTTGPAGTTVSPDTGEPNAGRNGGAPRLPALRTSSLAVKPSTTTN